jgi:hypothetical protein
MSLMAIRSQYLAVDGEMRWSPRTLNDFLEDGLLLALSQEDLLRGCVTGGAYGDRGGVFLRHGCNIWKRRYNEGMWSWSSARAIYRVAVDVQEEIFAYFEPQADSREVTHEPFIRRMSAISKYRGPHSGVNSSPPGCLTVPSFAEHGRTCAVRAASAIR